MNSELRFTDIKQLIEADTFDIAEVSEELLKLKILIKGNEYHGTIPGELTRSLWTLQESLYRAAAEILHGQPNISKLTNEERLALQLNFEVKQGSSDISASTRLFLQQIAEGFKDMESHDKKWVLLAAIIVLGGGYFASESYQTYSTNNAFIEHAQTLVQPLNLALENGTTAIAKSSPNADSVSVGQRVYDKEAITQLNQKAQRQGPTFSTIGLTCVVTGIKKVKPFIYRLELTSLEDNSTISVEVNYDKLFTDTPLKNVADFAPYIDDGQSVWVELLVKETKTSIEYSLLSLENIKQ